MTPPRLLPVRAAFIAAFTATIFAASRSPAQTPEDDFELGQAALARKDYATACPALRRAYEASDARGALVTLARCEDEGGNDRLATSLKLWRRVAERFGDQPGILREARARVEALEVKAPRITLRKATGTSDVRFTLDGAPAPLDIPILLDAGPHTLGASAEGYPTQSVDVILKDGEYRQVEFDPGTPLTPTPLPAATAPGQEPPAPTEAQRDESLFVGGIVAGAVGLAGLALFGVSAAVVADAEAELDAACPTRRGCDAGAIDASDRGKAWLAPNAVGLVVGVLGVGLGATLLVIDAQDDDVAAAIHPGGVEVRGRF